MKYRVADYIAEFFYNHGVRHIFSVTGAGIMHLTDGQACHPELEAVFCHHEQSAAMALEAYSRTSEQVGVGYFTTGPGATNAITGLAGAWQDSVACVFISGQVKRAESANLSGIPGLRQFGVQELDILPVVSPLCKYATIITDPMEIRFELEKGLYLAKTGRPGPVWFDIPMDVQGAPIEKAALRGFDYPKTQQKDFSIDHSWLEDALRHSERPVMIAGRGVRTACALDVCKKFAEEYQIPVVTPYLGIDNFEFDWPFYIGKTGIKGDRAANFAMQNSDLILAVGTSLHVSVIGYNYEQFARTATKIIVDIDMTSHKKKTIKIDRMIEQDAKKFFEGMLTITEEVSTDRRFWNNTCLNWKRKYPVCLEEYEIQKSPLNIYSFIKALNERSAEKDVIISDAGSAFYATSQAIEIKKHQRYVPSGAMATMGYSLPAAIGAACVPGVHHVHAISGDGSLQQNLQELAVLRELQLPVKLFVLNNNGYLSIRNSQRNYFEGRLLGTGPESGLWFPDLEKLAATYELSYVKIDHLDNLRPGLEKCLNDAKPWVIDVVCLSDQKIIPTVASKLNENGNMVSRPLEDLAPFLDRDEYRQNLLIPEV